MAGLLGHLVTNANRGVAAYLTGTQQGQQDAAERARREQAALIQQAALALQQRQADEATRQHAEQQSRTTALDALNGILPGTAPVVEAPRMLQTPLGGIVDRLPTPENDPTRYQQVGDRYIDRTQTPEARQERQFERTSAAQQAAAQRAELVRAALAKQQADASDARLDKTIAAGDRRSAAQIAASDARAAAALAARDGGTAPAVPGQPPVMNKVTAARTRAAQNDYHQEQVIKNAEIAKEAFVQVQSGYNAVASGQAGAGDLAMIYGLAKLFDPGSVVREGETTMVRQTGGLPAEVLGYFNRVQGGGSLDQKTRDRVLALAQRVAAEKQQLVVPVQARYGRNTRAAGVDSSLVAYDPWEGTPGLGSSNVTPAKPTTGGGVAKKYGIDLGRP